MARTIEELKQVTIYGAYGMDHDLITELTDIWTDRSKPLADRMWAYDYVGNECMGLGEPPCTPEILEEATLSMD